MAELRGIVDDIRSILYSDVNPDADKLERLFNEYVASCEETNRLLRDCDDLIERGLRDEALQRSDAHDLLDRVALLDFPERQQWAEYVSICGLPSPPEIEMGRAADLNEAYAVQQPLEPLLRLHRLHALAKSPLPKRIGIMRRIARQDGGNPIWSRGIKEFERVRHQQLKAAVQQASRGNDIKSLASLEQELRSPLWTTEPDKSLVNLAIEAHTQLRQSRARTELDRLQRELNEAYADFDAARARPIRARWNALSAIADLGDRDADLLDLVAPAFEWLRELDASEAAQQEYEGHLAQLHLNLDDWIHDRPAYERLKTLEESLAHSEAGIPEVDQVRLEERYLQFRQKEEGERRWKVIGAVAAVVLVAGATGLGVVLFLQSQELNQTVASLESLIAAENFEGAQQFVTTLESSDPRKFNAPRVQKLRSDLEQSVQQEQARQRTFESKLQEARQIGLQQPTWDSLPAARTVLASAGKVAKRDSEKLAFNELGRQIREAERQMLKQEQDKFLAAAEELQQRYETAPEDNLDALLQLSEAYGRLNTWEHVPEEIKRTPRDMQTRIEGQVAGMQRMLEQTRLLEKVTLSVGNRKAFQARLTSAKSHPAFSGNRQGRDFATVVGTDPRLWAGIEAWNEFIADVERVGLTTLGPEDATELMARSLKLTTEHPGYPGEPRVKKLIEMLDPITQRRTSGGERIDAAVVGALTNVTIAQVYYLKTKSDEWYYSDEKPRIVKGDYHRIQYFKNLNLDKAGGLKSNSEIANPRAGTDFQWLSPQSVFSQEALRLHQSLTLKNWDKVYLELLSRLLNDGEMDPVFKYQLLQAILQPALKGSWPLQQGFQKHLDLVAAGTVNTQENYFDPSTEESAAVRQAATGVLGQMPNTATSLEAVRSAMQSMESVDLGPHYRWIGWLHLGHRSHWICDMPARKKPRDDESGELFVVHAASTSDPPQFKSVGKVAAGQVQLDEASSGALLAGRPVFFVAGAAP